MLAIQVDKIIDLALAEDLGWGDITTEALIPSTLKAKGVIIAKAEGILAGIEIARRVFLRIDSELRVTIRLADGARIKPKDKVATVTGCGASILKGERLALNFLQQLSGVATETARYVEAVKGLPVQIIDTRKTVPGLRLLQKYAVTVGGGKNHRFHLGDGILIKDNHLAALASEGFGLTEAIRRARRYAPHTVKIEVEVESYEQALEAVKAGADMLLLDNMTPEEMKRVTDKVRGRVLTEASGGVRLHNVRAVAETGVDLISVGALTHSSKALDLSLDFELA